MKTYVVIGCVVLASALGVLTFADLPATAPLAEAVPAVDDPAWDAWRVDFDALLAADPGYQTAEEARWAYDGEDPDEQARLQAVRDARYYELARIVFEQHFGKWIGDDAAFEALMEGTKKIGDCAQAAVQTCGKGNVCWVLYGGDEDCRFACGAPGTAGGCLAVPTG